MKMATSVSSQRKRKRSEKQDNTGRHQLYDSTKRTRKFSLKWKDDFLQDSLKENNRILAGVPGVARVNKVTIS